MKKQLYLLTFFFSLLFAADSQQSFWETYTSALRGDKIAQFNVGVIYERGIGIESNQTQAAHWFEESARQGHVDAQYNIAIMYASGRGVEADEGLAMMWLGKAAKQGDKEARKLLIEIVDGKLDNAPAKKVVKGEKTLNESVEKAEIESITPTTLVTKVGAAVCDSKGLCTPYKAGSILTSTSKKGRYYKISGTATKKGWMAYEKEGWVDEESVEIRR